MAKVSTAVKDQVEAGLIATDGPIRALVTKARYVVDATYNKTNRSRGDEDAMTLAITYVEKARRKEKGYKGDICQISCGPVSRLIPCDDDGGKSAEPPEGSTAGGFGTGANVSIFFKHLEEAVKDAPEGLECEEKLSSDETTEDISCLQLFEVTIDRVNQPERKGLRVNKPEGTGTQRKGTVVIWKEIHDAVEDIADWRGAKGGDEDEDEKPKSRRRKKPAEEEEEEEEAPKRGKKGGSKVDAVVIEVLDKLLPDADDAIDLEALAKKCYPIIKKNTAWAKQRTAILAKLGEDEFLAGLDSFVVDEGALRRL